MKRLYFGDNLDILKELYREFPAGFIDMIYNDPPFNSGKNYNILFESVDMTDTKAQREAFNDTWSNISYIDTINEIKGLDMNLYNFLNTLENLGLPKSYISYLSTMSLRIWYMRKLLKPTGSFFLHCDPTMSHYLKIICDLIFGFGKKYFRNEIIWHYRKWPSGDSQFQRNHDVILFYTPTEHKDRVFNIRYMPRAASTQKRFGNKKIVSGFEENGSRIPSAMEEEDSKGVQRDDVWDISRVPPIKMLFPTEKPFVLLERIIDTTTKEGDLVADFFCGCGTTVMASEVMKRNWIGVDISHLSIKLITNRLVDMYGDKIKKDFQIIGFPKDIASARELALTPSGKFKFEEWIVEVMLHGVLNTRKNETGYDGFMTFDIQSTKSICLIEVKSGNATLTQLNHFIKTVGNKKADMGIFVCFSEQITAGMVRACKKEGFYKSDIFGDKYSKIQVISVEDIIDGKLPNRPVTKPTTFKSSDRVIKSDGEQQTLEIE